MKLRESQVGNVDIFHLEGEIDLHYAPALRALFNGKAASRCRALIVDLASVPFIDSTGISVLIEYLRDVSDFDGQFCLAAPTPHVRDVFEIVQLGKALRIYDSVDEAVAALTSGVVSAPARPLFGCSVAEANRREAGARIA
jgi:anti-anti-sigma factor